MCRFKPLRSKGLWKKQGNQGMQIKPHTATVKGLPGRFEHEFTLQLHSFEGVNDLTFWL